MKRIFPFSTIILLVVLFCNDIILAQETPSTLPEFPIGAFTCMYKFNRYKAELYNTFSASGMNFTGTYIDETTKGYLKSNDIKTVAGNNNDGYNELIKHYGSSHYSKWEAEENQPNDSAIGIKHRYGSQTEWRQRQCWSSIGLTTHKDSLMFGPHYYQEKIYHRYYFDPLTYQNPKDLRYIPRFSMALSKYPAVVDTEVVCLIKIVHRYMKYTLVSPGTYDAGVPFDSVLRIDTLRVSRFNADGSFKDIYFDEKGPLIRYYVYDTLKFTPDYGKTLLREYNPLPPVLYRDIIAGNGIQFCIDWLRSDTLCTLYIDYTEVYDVHGWARYLLDPEIVADSIKAYALAQSSNFPNLKYFEGGSEPASIDCIIPHKTVDSLVRDATINRSLYLGLTIAVPPHWPLYSGEKLYKRILEAIEPEVMLVSYSPYYVGTPVPDALEILRAIFQEAHTYHSGFWYIGQTFGDWELTSRWKEWEKPDSVKLKSTIMLALAHGSKGITFWPFDSWTLSGVYTDAIVDSNLQPTELYNVIKNNFVPRLKNNLGKTLLGLDYTGNYLPLKHITPTENPVPQPPTYDYLTIGLQATNHDMNWHVGFFNRINHNDDKYFLMANLWTNSTKNIQVRVTPSVPGYINYRFRNVEPENNFDLTFTTQSENTLTFPAGEGYLFEVAPVVKYGGKLIANETAGNGMTLYDAMTIESGATLTVNGTYYIYADIEVKDGGVLQVQPGASLVFYNGAKLKVNGGLTAVGTSSNKITFDFTSQQSGNGINTEDEDFLTMTNCIIKNAVNGLSIIHRSRGTALVRYNEFENCLTGISLVNATSALIQGNEFINTQLAIFTSNVSGLNIISNQITGNNSNFPGLILNSSSGYVRKNSISGHFMEFYLAIQVCISVQIQFSTTVITACTLVRALSQIFRHNG